MLAWCRDNGIDWHFIAPGKSMQNGSWRASMAACATASHETLFFDLDDARAKIAAWAADFNTARPHSALGYFTPAVYAANFAVTQGARPVEALIAVG